MSILERDSQTVVDSELTARSALMKALDMGELWHACASLVIQALPCHSCSLMFDIDGLQPQQGHHYLAETQDGVDLPVTSLDVAAPYLIANPKVRSYTFSQILSQDALAEARLRAQNPAPGWREFIHLAFWNERTLEAVLSIRIRAGRHALSDRELAFLTDLYPVLDAGLHRVRTLESERIRHRAFEALLYKLPVAVAIIDQHLRTTYLSPDAIHLCHRWGRNGDHLPERFVAVLGQHLCARHGVSEDPIAIEGGTLMVQHPNHGELRVCLEISAPLHLASGRRHYIVTMIADGQSTQTTHERLARSLLLQKLSPTERKVAKLVVDGLRNESIANQLCRSRKTIESQISSIYRKLDVENRAQLVRLLA